MTEKPKEKQSETYPFIYEKIVPNHKKRWKRKISRLLSVIGLAAVFGFVAQVVFLLSGDYLKEWLNIEKERNPVDLSRSEEKESVNTPTPKQFVTEKEPPIQTTTDDKIEQQENADETVIGIYDSTDDKTAENTTKENMDSKEEPLEQNNDLILAGTDKIENKNPLDNTETVMAGIEVSPENDKNTEWIEQPELDSIEGFSGGVPLLYLYLYETVQQTVEEFSKSIVTVESIERGVDWFQEVYEKRTRTTGLILGNDGVDLLILVGTEQFFGATSIEVFFENECWSGRVYSLDKAYGLAVIAVPLAQISEEILEQIQLGILAKTEDITLGTPVLAVGAPNGYENSLEIGMITSLGSTIAVSDGELSYFTTNITNYENGYGFVINLNGEVLGMITHTNKIKQEDNIFCAVSFDSLYHVIVKLLNHKEWAYFGICGQDIPENLKREYQLEQGVYVSEVENASPALHAGIKTGDIILSLNDVDVEGIQAFSNLILQCDTKETVQVKVLRKAENGLREVILSVTLTEKNGM